ncbi:hypothetical protein NBT05_02490 [Aquimarina sp. ERC-38]|uniref:hypothetical protein n=1 Tax=Aquimarina sp. ERC-38 TaxID=2949996 RepID=UPI0022471B0A|nr:hypothetical protein [Aquimarina sp. ERC-38]UZO81350.1 hypothetical protein NBT05_02490 [Aquimarina sp. ERC-38]
MKIELYQELPGISQHFMVQNSGVLLKIITREPFDFVLYGIHNFYVEIIYRKATHKVFALNAFTMDDVKLDFYLQSIEIKIR